MGLIRLIHFHLFGPLRLKKGSQALLSLKGRQALLSLKISLCLLSKKGKRGIDQGKEKAETIQIYKFIGAFASKENPRMLSLRA